MKEFLKLLKYLGFTFLAIIGLSLIITTLNYFDLISSNTLNRLKIIIPSLILFINAFFLGRESLKRGYLEGIKLASIFLLVILFCNLVVFNHSLDFKILIYISVMYLSSILGSMLGINLKKKN